MNNKQNFPVYRKYPDNRSFFAIYNENEFEEIKLLGNFYSVHRIKATILPERNYISDMLNLHNNHWVESSESEFTTIKSDCQQHKKLLP